MPIIIGALLRSTTLSSGILIGGVLRRFGGWSPTSLFGNSEIGGFYPLAAGTVFTDSAMSTEATPGDPVGGVLDLSGNGNHLIQTTAASKPVYTRHPKAGVRNLLDGQPVSWTVFGTAPTESTLGNGNSAARWDFVSGERDFQYTTLPFEIGDQFTFRCRVDDTTGLLSTTTVVATAGAGLSITLLVSDLVGGYATKTATATETGSVQVRVGPGANGNHPADGVLVLGDVQIEKGASATDYQTRVNQYDVTEAGVQDCYLLTYDGVDDYLVSASTVDRTSVDVVTLCAGVSTDAASTYGVIFETGGNSGQPGQAGMWAPYETANAVSWWPSSSGSQRISFGAAPLGAAVLTGQRATLRVNGSIAGTNGSVVSTAGTNALVTVGARNGGTLGFTGAIGPTTYICRDLTDAEVGLLEAWTAGLTPEATLA